MHFSIVLDRLLESKSECVGVANDGSLRRSLNTGKGWRCGHDGATKFSDSERAYSMQGSAHW